VTDHAVIVERLIPAPPERVYRAWLEPELMRRWLAPSIYTVSKVEVDERVGGKLRVWQSDAGGNDVGGAEAEIAELVSPERIALRWWFVGPDRRADPGLESLLTVTFTRTGDERTLVRLAHSRLAGLRASWPYVADNIEGGWASTLSTLASQINA
jgi:uncharacterized protein YndB with AHSA1/START domain